MKRDHLRAALFILLLLIPAALHAQDSDGDGITDALERELLSAYAPVWRANDAHQRPPLPLDWYVQRCQLRWYDQEYNGHSSPGTRLGDTGNQVLSLSFLASYRYDQGHYRLSFKDHAARDGHDGQDSISWDRLQRDQRGVYGRVAPLDGRALPDGTVLPGPPAGCETRYLVQFFMFFGFNVTDHPENSFGPCGNFGNHEGDIICVEFEVARAEDGKTRLERAVYNNHGRKLFVDSPAALRFEQGRPVVFLERQSQEPVPWPGGCGFWPDSGVPACVGTDRVFEGFEILDYRIGGECEDFQVVREHYGGHFGADRPGFFVTEVVNLGEAGRPGPRLEAQFVHRYPGLFGDEAHDQIFICYLFGKDPVYQSSVTSPKSPRHQTKMWWREGHEAARHPAWTGRRGVTTVHVQFDLPADLRDEPWRQDGSPRAPFGTLAHALPVLASGGTLVLAPGTGSFHGTLCQPLTLTAAGGAATIRP